MSVFVEYGKKVMKHWLVLALGIAAGAGIADNLNSVDKMFNIPWWAWLIIVLCAINIAQFLAWKDIRQLFVEQGLAFIEQNQRTAENMKEVAARVQQHEQSLNELKAKK